MRFKKFYISENNTLSISDKLQKQIQKAVCNHDGGKQGRQFWQMASEDMGRSINRPETTQLQMFIDDTLKDHKYDNTKYNSPSIGEDTNIKDMKGSALKVGDRVKWVDQTGTIVSNNRFQSFAFRLDDNDQHYSAYQEIGHFDRRLTDENDLVKMS